MSALGKTPCFISLHRLALLTGHSRVTLLLRIKDGKLLPDATIDVGNGRFQPLFCPDKVALLRIAKNARGPHPLL